jgi:heat shock protein HtpX
MEEQARANRRKITWGVAIYTLAVAGTTCFLAIWTLSRHMNPAGFIFLGIAILLGICTVYWATHSGMRMMLRLCRATPIAEAEFDTVKSAVEDIAIASGMPAPELMVIDGHFSNAFSLIKGERGIIVFSRGLDERLDAEELRAVIAHEMAHLYNEDTRLNTFIISLRGFSFLIRYLLMDVLRIPVPQILPAISPLILASLIFLSLVELALPEWFILTATALLIILLSLLLLVFIGMIMQRLIDPSREMLADYLGTTWTMHPEALVSALQKASPQSAVYSLKPLKGVCFLPPHFQDLQPTLEERIEHLQDTLRMKLQ